MITGRCLHFGAITINTQRLSTGELGLLRRCPKCGKEWINIADDDDGDEEEAT
jgi:hypothetical protein